MITVKTNGKFGTLNDAKEKFERTSITPNSYLSRIVDAKPKGIERKYENKPKNPVRNPKSIVAGIKGKIKILAGNATSERLPIL